MAAIRLAEIYPEIKPFLCDVVEKSLLRHEWEKWLRSFELYLASEEIKSPVKKKNKLLHLGGPQLQEVVYNISGALEEFDEKANNDTYGVLVEKLNININNKYFLQNEIQHLKDIYFEMSIRCGGDRRYDL